MASRDRIGWCNLLKLQVKLRAIGQESKMNSDLEYRLKAEDQLCFIHIPKTAGTTLTAIIDQKFHVDQICPELEYLSEIDPQYSQAEITPEQLAKYRFLRGHFSYHPIDQFLSKKPLYLTILRNPIDRTISLYNFLKRAKEKGEPEYNEFTKLLRDATDHGLEGFMANPHPIVKMRISNPQTRLLGIEPQGDRSDAEVLAIAKANLEKFIFVGLTERFQDSVFLLFYIFGWYPSTSYSSLRVASNKSTKQDLPQSVLDVVIEANQLDLALYDYAEKLFCNRFSQMLAALSQKYDQSVSKDAPLIFNLLEKHYEQRYAEQKIPRIDSIDFDFRQAISGSGWHHRNGRFKGLKGNTAVRWTGSTTESTLDFPLATEANLSIKLRITDAASPEVLASLKLFVNDRSIPLQKLSQQGKITVWQGKIPQAALQSEKPFTRLKFTVDRTLPLNEVKRSSSDSRQVGIALHRIQIQPVNRSPQDPNYLYLLFPLDEPNWVEADRFLAAHIQPHETIVAPNEFYEKYPQQIQFYSGDLHLQAQWIVIHKGQRKSIDPNFLRQTLNPVFANEVFVIFTTRSNVPVLKQSPHIPADLRMPERSPFAKIQQKIKTFWK
ncbi:sulfotransferase family 2 domain-containing protein [Microcoleus sp. FACHB-1515]|uniref:sulfotransferase family 2 domain-containing protein n=2 Tax=Cyanophyceae TaxID=3028117 RepID=UPI001684FD2D|nr:sulfotransferase family 2 domain-containing protein [Microcoleus sp. FACHB-1515]MBD2092121.1 sulfotransferase family 2 domain-containing protein [Microcoleus sp. FACHB-1515]